MININLNYYIKFDKKEWITREYRENVRIFLSDKCTGDYLIIHSPSSIVSKNGYETMDKSYTFIFFENKKDLTYFKLKWE